MPSIPIPQFLVTINGVPDPTIFGYITEIVVDTSVFMPSMFVITLQDKSDTSGLLKFVDNVLIYRLGAPVTISATVSDRKTQIPSTHTLIIGEITSIEPVFTDTGNVQFRIRGYDRAHRLTLGKKTRAWGGGDIPTVSDAQIVGQIAAEYGLAPKIDLSSLIYTYVLQYDQSDWDFLWSRARMLGYEMYVDNGLVLNFVKAGKPRSLTSTSLKWGENLYRFEPRIVSAGAVTSVTAQGWDQNRQTKVYAKASSYTGGTMAKIPGATIPASKSIGLAFLSKAEDFVADPNATSPSIASSIAEARMGEHESQFVRANGESEGHPGILAGTTVTVTQVGVRFSGKYYVTEARHIFRNGDYLVRFEATGRNPNTIRHLLMGKELSSTNKLNGVVVGVVTNNNDPLYEGRVKVKFPWMEDNLETGWVRVAMVGSGKNRGVFFTPEINDEVLVAFEQGNFNAPFIVGSLWSGKNKPPLPPSGGSVVVAGTVNQRIVRSSSGHIIVFDDTKGAEKIIIKDKTGKNSLEIDSVMNSFTINSGEDITIKSVRNLTIEAGGQLILKSKLDSSINAETKVDIGGKTAASMKVGPSEVSLEMAGAALKGTKVDVQAQAAASVKGNAMVEIQGGIVKIN
jgi:uncharacterized protein involved in type VI secretion and phage assembly